MNWDVWGPALANGLCALLAAVLSGIILLVLRRVVRLSRETQTAADSASTHARTAAQGSAAASLDVASLQGRLRGLDAEVGSLREDASANLAHRLDTERRLARLEEFAAIREGEQHARRMGAGQVSS